MVGCGLSSIQPLTTLRPRPSPRPRTTRRTPMNKIKVGDALVLALAAFVFLLACSGCALLSKTSTQEQKLADVRNLSFAAASVGTTEAIRENPTWRPRFVDAEAELDQLVTQKIVTGGLLRKIVASLPVKELKAARAIILVES